MVMQVLVVALSLSASAAQAAQTAVAAPPSHDRAFWRAIVAADFAVPSGATAPVLAAELDRMLGDADPELRDAFAGTILPEWIRTGTLDADALRPRIRTWIANLSADVQQVGTDRTLRRSFSALMLAAVVNRDNAEPLLTPDEFAAIRDAAIGYLNAEQDVRGFDDRLGWIHSAAHTADVLRALNRSQRLAPTDPPKILDAVRRKLRTAPVVFTFGEDERFARAIAMLLIRDDFNLDAFRTWVADLAAPTAGPPTVASLRAGQNVKNMLAKLGVLLARQPTLPPAAATARDLVLAAVRF
jgi:hypothetical protein